MRIDRIEGKIYECKNNLYAFINVDKEDKIISSIDRYGNKKENLPTDFTDILTVKGKNVLTEHQDISGKANVGDSYTKKESDELFTTKKEFSDNFEHKKSKSFVNVLHDSENKIIEGIDKKGKKHLYGGLNIQGADIEKQNNVKSVFILADKDGRKIINIDKKGYVDIPNLRQKNRTDNVVIVDKSGKGDYTELEECLSNIKDTQTSPKTIIVFPGVYTMGIYKDVERRHTGYRNLSIIGVNKHSCIIRQDDGVYTTSPYVDAAAIKIGGNCYLANLTIISTDSNYNAEGTNRSYCVHLDTSANSGDRLTIRDCIMINDHYSCIGIGLKPNYIISIENCELTSTFKQGIQSSGTILCHESRDEGDNNETLILKNNIINNTNGRYAVSIHDGYSVGGVIHCIFKDNVLYAPHSSMPFYRQSESLHIIEFESYGNNVSAMNHSCYRSYPSIFRRNITLQGKNVLVTGDSITRGYINGQTVTDRNWPTLLKENIGINTINNTAVGGALFTKISGYGCISDYMNVDVSGYDCVIVAGGVNDWQLGVDESTFKQTMKDLVDNINSNYPHDIPVVFITPINVAGYPQSTPVMPLQMYRNIITETVISNDTYRRFSVIQGSEFGFPEASEDEKFTNAVFGDKIHPTELGYATLYINGVMNYINK